MQGRVFFAFCEILHLDGIFIMEIVAFNLQHQQIYRVRPHRNTLKIKPRFPPNMPALMVFNARPLPFWRFVVVSLLLFSAVTSDIDIFDTQKSDSTLHHLFYSSFNGLGLLQKPAQSHSFVQPLCAARVRESICPAQNLSGKGSPGRLRVRHSPHRWHRTS